MNKDNFLTVSCGILFLYSSILLKNVFYIGVIENAGVAVDPEKSKISFAGTYIDSNDAIAIYGYTFHYILEYADSSHFVDGANYDCLIIKKDASGYDMAFAGNESEYDAVKDDFSITGLLKVNIYDEDDNEDYSADDEVQILNEQSSNNQIYSYLERR